MNEMMNEMKNRPDKETQEVLDQLASLTPAAEEAPLAPGRMLAQIKTQIAAPTPGVAESLSWRIQQMLKRKYALVAALVVLVVATFSLPPVRAAASDFLGLFRVQKFAPISVSPAQLQQLERLAEQGLFPGELEMIEEPGSPQEVDSLVEASVFTGRNVRTLADLGAPAAIRISNGGSGRLVVNLENARAILEAAEVDPLLLPDSLDGAVVDARLFPVVEQEWADLFLVQTASPVVDYPDDVDLVVLGEALLRFVGLTEGEARRLAQNIDWTNTLVLPIPEDLASFSEVRVDGVSGLGLSELGGNGASLVWEKDGTVYMLASNSVTLDELRDLAESLR
jgi:hypothetical protein